MAVTGTETVSNIIEAALVEIEAHTMGQTVASEQQTHARNVLQRMLKHWQNEHCTPFHMRATQTVTLTGATNYTMSPARPISIQSVRYSDGSSETPLIELTADEYDSLPVKTSTGTPTQWFYDRQKEAAKLYVWPVGSTGTLSVTYERESEDIASAADVIDIPAEWYEAAIYGLALRLFGPYGRQAKRSKKELEDEAKDKLNTAMGSGFDGQSVYFRLSD